VHFVSALAHHFGRGGAAPGGVRGKAFGHPRDCSGHRIPQMDGDELPALRIEFRRISVVRARPVPEEKRERPSTMRASNCSAPTGRHDVQLAIAVEVARGHALPQDPGSESGQGENEAGRQGESRPARVLTCWLSGLLASGLPVLPVLCRSSTIGSPSL
jgi:hypothetical protein